MVEYYDKILLAIAAALATGFAVGVTTAVPMAFAMAGSVLVATPIVYDAIFRNPPLPASGPQRAAVAIVWHVLLAWLLVTALY